MHHVIGIDLREDRAQAVPTELLLRHAHTVRDSGIHGQNWHSELAAKSMRIIFRKACSIFRSAGDR
jgi:hypothetical protein